MRWNDIPLPSGVPTLPEELKAAGYRTAGFVAGYPLFGDRSGLRRGFDHYSDVFFPLLAIHKGLDRLTPVLLMRKLGLIDTLTRTADDVTEEAMRWLEAVDGTPFFLFIHYYDPHSYYAPPARFRREFGWEAGMERTNRWMLWEIARGRTRFSPRDVETVRRLYDAEIRFVDHEIGRLLARLKALGLQRSSIVIVTADHGETLLERIETSGKAFTHGDWLHERDLRVPLLMTGPGVPEGVVAAPVGLDDIAPTVLGLLGMSPVEGMTGVGLLGASSEQLDERALVSYNSPDPGEPTRLAVHLRRYRLLIEPESGRETLEFVGDAREGPTLTRPAPQDLKAMRNLALALPMVEKRQLLDAAEIERLRALGYAQ
jgi:arylsulfatase